MLPYSPLIFEITCSLNIVVHSAIVFWLSNLGSESYALYYYYYSWPEQSLAEQQINGAILPFLM